MELTGQIIEAGYYRYRVAVDDKEYVCRVKSNLALAGSDKSVRCGSDVTLYVGDLVRFQPFGQGKQGLITALHPRKNALVRPYVANLDGVLIVVAPLPKPDWLLVDKILLNCAHAGIAATLVVNKCDLPESEQLEGDLAAYAPLLPLVRVSAHNGQGVEGLRPFVADAFVALAGQSAVGKTSLLSRILGRDLATDGLTKWERGRHTTRTVTLYRALDGRIADTCGFSMLEAVDGVKPDELRLYYEDFMRFAPQCRYRGCTHQAEPDCAVKRAVAEGQLDAGRYRRYQQIYEELKPKWESKPHT